jgi:hypothetical protein
VANSASRESVPLPLPGNGCLAPAMKGQPFSNGCGACLCGCRENPRNHTRTSKVTHCRDMRNCLEIAASAIHEYEGPGWVGLGPLHHQEAARLRLSRVSVCA